MNKLILASVSGIALMGLAACSDTDDTTTQATPPEQVQPMEQPAVPNAVPPATPDTVPPAAPMTPDEPATPPTVPPAN